MFSQQPDPISGGAGWVGASFLGLVLSWLLLKHLPDMLKLIREMVTEFRKETEAQRQVHGQAMQVLTQESRAQRESIEQLVKSVAGLVKQVETLLEERKP